MEMDFTGQLITGVGISSAFGAICYLWLELRAIKKEVERLDHAVDKLVEGGILSIDMLLALREGTIKAFGRVGQDINTLAREAGLSKEMSPEMEKKRLH